jgi:opacity protein-like surface antigen
MVSQYIRYSVFGVFLGVLQSACWAYDLPCPADIEHLTVDHAQGWFLGLGTGVAFPKMQHQSFQIPYTPFSAYDAYSVGHVTSTPIVSADGGYYWKSRYRFPYAYFLSLRYQYVTPSETSGSILVLNNPAFPYGFHFSQHAHSLMLFGKMEWARWKWFAPYFSAGVGGAETIFERYSEYPETAVSVPRNSAAFADKSFLSLAYAAGVGLDLYPSEKCIISLGYDYDALGTLKTGQGAYDHINNTYTALNFGHLTSNTVVAQAEYLFAS